MRAPAVVLVSTAIALAAPAARAEEVIVTPPPRFDPPDGSHTYTSPLPFVTPAWFVTQLVPSPELAIGTSDGQTRAAFGLRWQLTPVLWSWGTHRRISRWRFLVVDPLARMSGSIALEQHFEYIGGHVDRLLARPGVKATFPLLHRGEYLAFSIGTSVYTYDSRARVAHDFGIYTLYGIIGAVATVAPEHGPLTTIATLRLRYF